MTRAGGRRPREFAPPPEVAPRLRVLVVDDEAPARRRVIRLLADDARFEIVAEAEDGIEALERIEQLVPDVIILDIQMPGLDGFEVLDAIGCRDELSVVFSTAFDAHALRAFDVHAVDYLLKPYTPERFRRALDKVCMPRAGDPAALARAVAAGLTQTRTRITLKTADGPWVTLPFAEIRRVLAANKHTCVVTEQAEHLVRRSFTEVTSQLDARFLQVQRGAVVNMDCVRRVSAQTHGDAVVELSDGSSLTLTRSYRVQFFARYAR